MNFPENLMYTESHEWVRFISETEAEIGLTDFAQHALGDIVFVGLPEVGDALTAGDPFADVESVKAVSDVFSPLSGEVSEVNEALNDDPAKINEAPYEAWLVRVTGITSREGLMNAADYANIAKEE